MKINGLYEKNPKRLMGLQPSPKNSLKGPKKDQNYPPKAKISKRQKRKTSYKVHQYTRANS